MDLSHIDRNRMTAAIVVTIVLLATVFMASGNSATETRVINANTTTTTLNSGLGTDGKEDAPANFEGPISADPNGQGQIAYPADNDGQLVRGTATFKRFPESATTGCSTALIPLGALITVRNLNNGHKSTCTNLNIDGLSGSFDIVLNAPVFEAIAELSDAPIPVELTW